MKAILFSFFVGLIMVGCGEQAQKEAVEGESKQKNHSRFDHSAKSKGDAVKVQSLLAETESTNAEIDSSLLTPCEACNKKVSVLSEACVGCGHPVGAMKKLGEDLVEGLADDFKEYKSWMARKKELDKELQDLRSEAKRHREFLDRLRSDPDFRDKQAREQLGYGEANERLYRLPDDNDEEKPQVQQP